VGPVTRWDKIGTTTGPTEIGGTVIPAGAELFIPIDEPGDMEDCPSCWGLSTYEWYPTDPAEQFRLHLKWHIFPPQVRYRKAT
jgi:hypothetical protein